MKNRGFTLVEILVAVAIFLMAWASVTWAYVLSQRLVRGGSLSIAMQSSARIATDKIVRNLHSALSASTYDNGNRIRFVIDPNRTPENTSDDITCEYRLSGTDLIYDPNLIVLNDEGIIARKVYKESNLTVFQVTGNLVIITFRIYEDTPVYGYHGTNITTSVKLRNA